MRRQAQLLLSPGFLFGLLLLLANDLIFKAAFHNALTGKLSDFAGLFVFPIFWTAFAPRRKRAIYFLTALGFLFWKSVSAQPLIDYWNELQVFYIHRTIDLTDLAALIALPFSYLYGQRQQRDFSSSKNIASSFAAQRVATCGIILISVFAFTATQRADKEESLYRNQYSFEMNKPGLTDKLHKIGLKEVKHTGTSDTPTPPFIRAEFYDLFIDVKYCKPEEIIAHVQLTEEGAGSLLDLKSITYFCDDPVPTAEKDLLAIFKREVVDKLGPYREKMRPAPEDMMTPTPMPQATKKR